MAASRHMYAATLSNLIISHFFSVYSNRHMPIKSFKILLICGRYSVNLYMYGMWKIKNEYIFDKDIFLSLDSGVLVGSFLHWVAHPRDVVSAYHNFILAFDLRDETFRQVPQPRDTMDGKKEVLNMVSELGGCLCVSYGNADIWIMKEYGIEDSWTKLLSISFPTPLKPLCYSKEGDKVLFDYDKGKELICYDLNNQTIDRIDIFESSEYNEKTYCLTKSGFVCASTLAFPIVNGRSSNSSCKKNVKKENSNKA
ncbi:F-box protein CPR1-like [Mercurialis annua]|uniref:F-box protein CPR1-like n=1 Tax=Mercurialis annua TaxID=3986 RepID=UPI00215E3289|nr:F-box protein CPR1-like [Mercurialis annua]